MQITQNRRRFLATLAATGAAGLIGPPNSSAQDGRLETTTVRIGKNLAAICAPAVYVVDELLRAEGFADVRYVTMESGPPSALALARGEIDFAVESSSPIIAAIDAGTPITILSGVHIGCLELFAREGIRRIPELKGKTVGVIGLGGSPH